ncbi:MAG: arginine--tRNA ligase [Anaerolineae bacterium]
MESLRTQLTAIVANAFAVRGFERAYGEVVVSDRPDLGQFQCNGALAAAKAHRRNPRQIAGDVVEALARPDVFREVSLAGPGFINLTLADEFLAAHLQGMTADERLGCPTTAHPRKIIVDYGGANIAKPMHVGHLRAGIIGESLKRLSRFLGHDVLGDVHLGDWGLPMGLIICELERRQPDLPYFDPDYHGPYPAESPLTISDLEEIYPAANQRAAGDPAFMEAARQATFDLQRKRPGYYALWRHFLDVSVAELKADYARLNVEFDLWLGESDVNDRIPPMVERLLAEGYARESEGAVIIDVSRPDDKHDIPPLILLKSDGAVLYGTTDLATIEQRVEEFGTELTFYVVDNRQSDHFRQVFRAAYKTGIAPPSVGLEHTGFGTMNGKDGKPFKTRAGGVMKLKDLIQMVTDKAVERMAEIEVAKGYDAAEQAGIARQVGLAALKFADLMNHRTKDYVFDLDRFSSFEGRTGPYLLYTAVRTKSILRKAEARGLEAGPLLPPASQAERVVMLKLAGLPDVLNLAFEARAPNHLCEYAYSLAMEFNRFYQKHHILREPDPARQASWLGLSHFSVAVLERVLDLLGIEVPERM